MIDIALQIARALVDTNAVRFTADSPIRFKSGILSPVYVDNRNLPYHPETWHQIIESFRLLIENERITFDVIAGMAVGGVPHSAALAYTLHKPSLFVRKEAKEHGKQQRVEGGEVDGRRVILVEDLVTTGGSSLSGIAALREVGAVVEDCLAIVSYGFDESRIAFDEAGVSLHTLSTFSHILDYARQTGVTSEKNLQAVAKWIQSPYTWGNSKQ